MFLTLAVFALPQATEADLNCKVEELHKACIHAINLTSDMHPKQLGLKPALWWNKECTEHIKLLRTLSGPAKTEAQKCTKSVFRQAKQAYYNKIYEEMTPDTIWKMAKWETENRTLPIPPLKDGDCYNWC